eukprot:239077_1
MGSSQSNQTKTQKSPKASFKSFFTWSEPEGFSAQELVSKTRVKLGADPACTVACVAVTNEPISKSDYSTFEWKVVIHKSCTHYSSLELICYVGFIDAEPAELVLDGHCILGQSNTHQFAAKYPMATNVASASGIVFTFFVDFASKTVKLSHINGVKPTKKLFPNLDTQWTFKGNKIYPAVGKDYGMTQFSICTKYDRQYDNDEKEGFGNKFNNDKDNNAKTLLIYKKYKINAPNSITWLIEQDCTKYRIDWGLRGSFCGLGIGRIRFIKPETGNYKVLFHFGFIFNGNDYKLTDVDFNSEFDDKHWMTLHLCDTDQIGIELCDSKSVSCKLLADVWNRNGEIEKMDYRYYRLDPGFCRTSVKIIADAINKEKLRKYELCYNRNDWTSMTDLSKYTNCMLFVMRMCKVCNMQIPDWSDIIEIFSKWEGSNKFATHWAHFKQYSAV